LFVLVAIGVCIAALGAAGCGSALRTSRSALSRAVRSPDAVVAVVAGKRIRWDDVQRRAAASGAPAAEALDALVADLHTEHEAARLGIVASDTDVDELLAAGADARGITPAVWYREAAARGLSRAALRRALAAQILRRRVWAAHALDGAERDGSTLPRSAL
jgi:hypothetical protein